MKVLLTLFCLFTMSTIFAQAETDFIHIDQFGYRLNDEKIAVISDPQIGYNSNESFAPGTSYQVRKIDGTTVFTGNITQWHNGETDTLSGDKAWHFDFSSINTPGDYYIYDATNNVKSYTFKIADDIYQNVLDQALRAFYYQRCGTTKASPYAQTPWTDTDCHLGTLQDLTSRSILDKDNAATEKDLSGGWHDAGDYNKYVNFCLAPVHDLLAAYEELPTIWGDNLNIPESGNGIPDILDEIKWELDWLLKMQLADGSVIMKISVDLYQQASPPSTDAAARYYSPTASSATRTACSIYAHAAIVYQSIGMTAYANLLKSKAELAWTWLQNNPATSTYDNAGFGSANPEVSAYEQEATLFTAAVYLFELTGEATYQTYVDAHYTDIHALQWNFWYPFETVFQDALLYYAASANATNAVKNAILNSFKSSVKTNNVELFPAYQAFSSPYRAYLKESAYVWGSNRVKANSALLYYNVITHKADPAMDVTYEKAAENYVHYLHGVNPQNLVYLSNMNNHGASKSCQEIYHVWFADGSPLDANPAPGFVPGGPNPNFDPTTDVTISPPEGQPAEKSYKDWNTSYPENSWEITEPANGYQASYVKMLSKFVQPSSPLPITLLEPLTASIFNNQVLLQWITATEINNKGFEIQRSDESLNFQKIDFIPASTANTTTKNYRALDPNPSVNNYYRYKQIDVDGHFSYSDIVHIQFRKDLFRITPNILSNKPLSFEITTMAPTNGVLTIYDSNGNRVLSKNLGHLTKGLNSITINQTWASGYYYASVRMAGTVLVQSFVVE